MTPYEKYIAKLQGLKDSSEGIIAERTVDMQNVIYDSLMEWMDNTLEYKNGELVATLETIDLLNDFSEGFRRTITKLEPYKNAVSGFVKSLPSLGNAILDHQRKMNGIDPKKAGVSEVQKIVVSQVIDAFTGNGLNKAIVQPLRDLLHQNISAGTRLQDAKKALKDYVKGGNDTTGKIARYATQTAQQAVDGYTGAINKRLMDTFPYKHMIVSGSLIATSAPQCRFAIKELGGIITKEQWEKKVKPLGEKHGLIAGTTFENLPLNKLHHGCRHEFTPIMLQDSDKIGENEIFTENRN
jgi:hypothetical protein